MRKRRTEPVCAHAHTLQAYAAKPPNSVCVRTNFVCLDATATTAAAESREKVEFHHGISGYEPQFRSIPTHCSCPFAS